MCFFPVIHPSSRPPRLLGKLAPGDDFRFAEEESLKICEPEALTDLEHVLVFHLLRQQNDPVSGQIPCNTGHFSRAFVQDIHFDEISYLKQGLKSGLADEVVQSQNITSSKIGRASCRERV